MAGRIGCRAIGTSGLVLTKSKGVVWLVEFRCHLGDFPHSSYRV